MVLRVPARMGGLRWGVVVVVEEREEEKEEVSLAFRRADLVAMPEQRARMFRATRSPRRRLRTGPRTVATWDEGGAWMGVPSERCHWTLRVWLDGVFWYGGSRGEQEDERAVELSEYFVEEGDAC